MKKKTFNITWSGKSRVREPSSSNYGVGSKGQPTPNAQRPTPNAQSKKDPRFDLEERLLNFSGRIIRLVDALPKTRAANHLAGQLLRSGPSPYGNQGEVEAAESRQDFIHKLKICLKELEGTRRWLLLVKKADLVSPAKLTLILNEELVRIFFSSIRTAERNGK